jgi:hypothetical protein
MHVAAVFVRWRAHVALISFLAAICQSEYVSVWVDEFGCMCRCAVPHWGRISTMAAMIFFQPSTYHPFSSLPPATIVKLPLAPRCVGVYLYVSVHEVSRVCVCMFMCTQHRMSLCMCIARERARTSEKNSSSARENRERKR